MAYEGPQQRLVAVTASEDLRLHQFKFVKLTGENTVGLVSATTDDTIGVLQDTPNVGQAANVCYEGITKVSANAALVAGNRIAHSVDGQAAVSGTPVGQVMQGAGAAGEIATVLINCAVPRGA